MSTESTPTPATMHTTTLEAAAGQRLIYWYKITNLGDVRTQVAARRTNGVTHAEYGLSAGHHLQRVLPVDMQPILDAEHSLVWSSDPPVPLEVEFLCYDDNKVRFHWHSERGWMPLEPPGAAPETITTLPPPRCAVCRHLAPHIPDQDGAIWCCETGCLCNGKDAKGNADPPPPEPVTPWNLFHRLWTKAVGTEGYVKAEWQELEKVISGPAASPTDSIKWSGPTEAQNAGACILCGNAFAVGATVLGGVRTVSDGSFSRSSWVGACASGCAAGQWPTTLEVHREDGEIVIRTGPRRPVSARKYVATMMDGLDEALAAELVRRWNLGTTPSPQPAPTVDDLRDVVRSAVVFAVDATMEKLDAIGKLSAAAIATIVDGVMADYVGPAPIAAPPAIGEPVGGADFDGRCNDCGTPRPGREDGRSWKRQVRDGMACANPDCPQAKVRRGAQQPSARRHDAGTGDALALLNALIGPDPDWAAAEARAAVSRLAADVERLTKELAAARSKP